MERLETQYEQRQTGWQRDEKTGLPKPVITTYHIGHGQQLARRDADSRRAELGPVEATQPGRQQIRRAMRKVHKRVAAQDARDAAATQLAALRADAAPLRKIRAELRAKKAAARRQPHPYGDLKFLNRGARKGVLLRRALELAVVPSNLQPTKKPRAKKATAA